MTNKRGVEEKPPLKREGNQRRELLKKAVWSAPTLMALGLLGKSSNANAADCPPIPFGCAPSGPSSNP